MPRKLDLGDVLGEAFSLYRAHASVLVPLAFWMFLAVAIVNGVAEDDVTLVTAATLLGLLVGTIYKGMVVSLVRDVRDGREDSSIGGLLAAIVPVYWPLIGAGLISSVGILVGTFLLIVPGLYLLTIWAVIAPAIVIERVGVIESLRRSRRLVEGDGWRVFGIVIVATLIVVAGAIALAGLATAIADGPIVRIVFFALASALTAPIEGLVTGVLYYRLLELKRSVPSDSSSASASGSGSTTTSEERYSS